MRITLLELVAILAMGVSTVQLQTPENAIHTTAAHRALALTDTPVARSLEGARVVPVTKATPPILAKN